MVGIKGEVADKERLCEKQKEERERVRDVNNAAKREERERRKTTTRRVGAVKGQATYVH